MKIRIGDLKKLLTEAASSANGPCGQTYEELVATFPEYEEAAAEWIAQCHGPSELDRATYEDRFCMDGGRLRVDPNRGRPQWWHEELGTWEQDPGNT